MRVAMMSLVLFAASGSSVRAAPSSSDALDEAAHFDQIEMVARRLRHDLVCTCPTCDRLRLDECPCGEARAAREQIAHMLSERDVSTVAAREAAYAAVRESFVVRLGPEVLASTVVRRHWTAVVVPIICVIAIIVLFALILRAQRRQAARGRGRRRGR